MSVLLEELRAEHRNLEEILNKIAEDLGASLNVRRPLFFKLYKNLMEHLKKEDDLFYPELKALANGNPKALTDLDVLAREEKYLEKCACDFLTRQVERNDLLRDFTKFRNDLRVHIVTEETIYFQAYESSRDLPAR